MARIVELEKFRETFESYIQSGNINFLLGSGASLPAIKLAGDIEASINNLLENDQESTANLITLDFIESLEAQHSLIDLGLSATESQQTLGCYTSFLMGVDKLLFERKNLLIPRQANIFTTNYDLFIEHAAPSIPSLILNDGFDRSSSTTSEYKFRPERYHDRTYRSGSVYSRQSELPTINLFKLHGSLNWTKLESDIILNTKYRTPLPAPQKNNPEDVRNALRDRGLILPNLRKFNSTLMDRTYYDLLRFFANSIEKENSLLITFGFSFSDEHILDITKRSLRNPTSQLIIFCYDRSCAGAFAEKFLSQRNALVVIPEEEKTTGFTDFNTFLLSISGETSQP